jgi:hypothetical protein
MDPHALIELLLQNEVLETDDAQRLFDIADSETGDIFAALEAAGCGTKLEVLKSVAEFKGLEFLDLRSAAVPPQLLKELPQDVMRIYRCFPTFVSGDHCKLCLVDPLDEVASSDLARLLAKRVEVVVADPVLIESTVQAALGGDADISSLVDETKTALVAASLGGTQSSGRPPLAEEGRDFRWSWSLSLLAVAVVALAAIYVGQKRSAAAAEQVLSDFNSYKKNNDFSLLSADENMREIERELEKLRRLLEKNEVDAIALQQLEKSVQHMEGKIESLLDIKAKSEAVEQANSNTDGPGG